MTQFIRFNVDAFFDEIQNKDHETIFIIEIKKNFDIPNNYINNYLKYYYKK